MSAAARARRVRAPPFPDPPGYARNRPESTLLYQLVEQHYPAFREMRADAGRSLPEYIEQEFDAYLKCGRLEEGFLRVRCQQRHAEKLVVVYRTISGYMIGKACLTRRTGHTGAVTRVQRFGSSLNLNVRFHMPFLDGVYRAEGGAAPPVFRPVATPGASELQALVEQIAERGGRTRVCPASRSVVPRS